MAWIKKFWPRTVHVHRLLSWQAGHRQKNTFHSGVVLPCSLTCWIALGLTSKWESVLSGKSSSGSWVAVVFILVSTSCPGRDRKELKCCREQIQAEQSAPKSCKENVSWETKKPPQVQEKMMILLKGPKKGIRSSWINYFVWLNT